MINALIPKKKKNKTNIITTPNKPFPISFSIIFVALLVYYFNFSYIITHINLV